MTYCNASDVRLLIHTNLTDDEIDDLIPLADSDLDDMLGGASITTTQKKKGSMRGTAIMIAERSPTTYTAGSTRVDYSQRTTEWRNYVRRVARRLVDRWRVADELDE